MSRQHLLAVAWTRFQPRTVALASALGGQARFIDDGFGGANLAARPLAYLVKSMRMWRLLSREDPKTVLVITPPVFSPLVAWLWCAVHRRTLVVDCHTGAFHSNRWAWARPLHRVLLRRAKAVLLHTDELRDLVQTWGAPALLVPDDLPLPSEAAPVAVPAGTTRVMVAGSLDANEPVAITIDAARLLPGVEFRFTGDPAIIPAAVRAQAPPNAVFTGYLAYPLFLGELLSADVVAVFSTDPRIMNRAAFEAVGLGCPLVLSDLPAVRERFGTAALFSANERGAMASTIAQAIKAKAELAALSVGLQAALRSQRERAVEELQSIIDSDREPVWRQRSAS